MNCSRRSAPSRSRWGARTGAGGGRRRGARRLAAPRRRVAPETRRVKVRGAVRPPGDKSISHRALLLAALAHGRSELDGLLTGADVKSTARVLRQLGVDISPVRGGGPVLVRGRVLARPAATLDCGNSGTTARL